MKARRNSCTRYKKRSLSEKEPPRSAAPGYSQSRSSPSNLYLFMKSVMKEEFFRHTLKCSDCFDTVSIAESYTQKICCFSNEMSKHLTLLSVRENFTLKDKTAHLKMFHNVIIIYVITIKFYLFVMWQFRNFFNKSIKGLQKYQKAKFKLTRLSILLKR